MVLSYVFPLMWHHSKLFYQVDLDSSDITEQIQFIYKSENVKSKFAYVFKTKFERTEFFCIDYNHSLLPVDPCTTRRIKCKNSGQFQILSNGQMIWVFDSQI
jgi:hypothetical protein